MDTIKAFWNFFLSYFKSNWQIEDYPLRYKIQKMPILMIDTVYK